MSQKSPQIPLPVDITTLFYLGNYVDATSFVECRGRTLKPTEWPKFIGALAFGGRLAEAIAQFDGRYAKMSQQNRIECRFYLAVGACRQSNYALARTYLAKNLRDSRQSRGVSKFFIYQGIAFYRYFCGRFIHSLRAAETAWVAASNNNFLFGKAFASDLLAHSLIETGEVRAGLVQLQNAIEYASTIGNGGLCASFKISYAVQSARFGINLDSIGNLNDLLLNQPVQNVYSRSGLLLELARQYYLRGRVDEAKKTLDDACHSIYGFNHRRFSAVLNLRYAYLFKLRGDNYQALTLIRAAREQLVPEVDLALEVECRGLEKSLCTDLKLDFDDTRLRQLTRKTGRFTAIRMERRQTDPKAKPELRGQDPLGDMKDDLAESGRMYLPTIARSGFWGMIWDLPEVKASEKALRYDLADDTVVLIDYGHVDSLPMLRSPIFRLFLQCISLKPCSKEDLIRDVWGYPYSPSKHDTLIYTTASRIRRALGSRAHWVQCLNGVYALSNDIRAYGLCQPDGVSHVQSSLDAPTRNDLNYRQRQILQILSKSSVIDVRSILQKFEVTDMTVRRDFRELLEQGLVQRIGRGRAIKYILMEN